MDWKTLILSACLAIPTALAIIACSINYIAGGEWDHRIWIPIVMLLIYTGWRDANDREKQK